MDDDEIVYWTRQQLMIKSSFVSGNWFELMKNIKPLHLSEKEFKPNTLNVIVLS